MGKNRRKKCEKSFFYSHEYRAKKNGGINARNNFSRNRQIVGAKNVGKKRRKKVRKSFLYSHEYREKKGGKTGETIFPETHE